MWQRQQRTTQINMLKITFSTHSQMLLAGGGVLKEETLRRLERLITYLDVTQLQLLARKLAEGFAADAAGGAGVSPSVRIGVPRRKGKKKHKFIIHHTPIYHCK